MTYQTKLDKHRRRVEIIVSIIFIIGIGACYTTYLHLSKGLSVLQAIENVAIRLLFLLVLMSISLVFIFAYSVIGRLIKRKQNNKKDNS